MVNVTQYINKSKDSAIRANLKTLSENFLLYLDDPTQFGGNSSDQGTLNNFCSNMGNISNAISSTGSSLICTAGDEWLDGGVSTGNKITAACARFIGDSAYALCIDSGGNTRQIDQISCYDTEIENGCKWVGNKP